MADDREAGASVKHKRPRRLPCGPKHERLCVAIAPCGFSPPQQELYPKGVFVGALEIVYVSVAGGAVRAHKPAELWQHLVTFHSSDTDIWSLEEILSSFVESGSVPLWWACWRPQEFHRSQCFFKGRSVDGGGLQGTPHCRSTSLVHDSVCGALAE